MAISNTKLNTGLKAIYTSTGENAIVVAYFCNTSTNPVLFSLHAAKSGESGGPDNIIYSNVNITASDTYVMDMEKLILGDGDSLWGVANEDDVVIVTICDVGV